MNGLTPVDYRHGDVALCGELALPAGPGPHPGVLIMHSGLGLSDETRDRAADLARHGYAAFAVDMYGSRGEALDPQEAGRRMEALQSNPAELRARATAGRNALVAQSGVDPDRLAVMGFCFGGLCALELARTGTDLKAVISFHGLLKTEMPAEAGAINGQVAIFTGAKDPLAPEEDVDALRAELTAAGAKWQLTVYGEGYHGFTGPREALPYEWIKYDPLLDAQSWASTLTLLNATLRDAVSDVRPQTQIH